MFTIREEDSVRDAVEHAMAENDFAEDMMFAAIWRISREPKCGRPLEPKTDQLRRLLLIPPGVVEKSQGMLVRYYVLESEHVAVVDWIRFLPFNPGGVVNPDAFTV